MKKTLILPLSALVLGALGAVLRHMERGTGFEPETGLAVPGNVYAVTLLILLVAAAVLLAILTRLAAPAAPALRFSHSAAAKTFCVIGAIGTAAAGALEIFSSMFAVGDLLGLIQGALALVTAVCLFAVVKKLSAGEEPQGVYLLAPVCCAAVRLIASYRVYAVDPVLEGYYVEILALVAHVLAFYALAGIYFSGRGYRRCLFFGLAAVTLSLVSAADGHSLTELGTMLSWAAFHLGIVWAMTAAGEKADKDADENDAL